MNVIQNNNLTCVVSKQILDDNFQIGIMVKAEPTSELDSGWSFLSGVETDEYFENPDYMSIVSLNEICQINSRILEFLNYPVDTVVVKNDQGVFEILNQKNNISNDKNQVLFNQENSLDLDVKGLSQNILKPEKDKNTNLYDENPTDFKNLSENDLQNIKTFIRDNFGSFDGVYKEIVSENISCNICIVLPNEKYDYYKVITIGASSLDMFVAENLKDENLERFELIMFLPKDWNFQFDKIFQDEQTAEQWYMPINILKSIARLPFEDKTWLGYGHSVCFKDSFKLGEFNNFILDIPNNLLETNFLKLENGKRVNFYCVIPVFQDEMTFNLENQTENLLEKIYEKNNSQIVNLNRHSCLN